MARIEAGEVQLLLEAVDCEVLLDEVASTLRPQAEGTGLELTVHVPEGPIVVNTDRRALSQIVFNLVGNAIKFTDRGSVRLTLRPGADEGSRGLEIRVDDSGIDILLADQHKLFAAFGRVNSARPGAPEGTGLGLHLSRRLAELLGGNIVFRSEFGKGSSFSLILPGQRDVHVARPSRERIAGVP